MKNISINIKLGMPYPMGITPVAEGVNIAVAVASDRSLTLCLYDKRNGHNENRIEIPDEFRIGDVYAFVISGAVLNRYCYAFYDGKKLFTDPYATAFIGCDKWGVNKPAAVFPQMDEFDWKGDKHPNIPFEDVFMYTLHVRGFTRHSSSGVKHKGTFEGIVEKIPYLKELGVNQIELMPAYEFDEVIKYPEYEKEPVRLPNGIEKTELEKKLSEDKADFSKHSINYWGYSKDALYFAPKAAYSGCKNPSLSMKTLVRELHRAGIELVMQFYFPAAVRSQLIIDCIRFWVLEYHIDGAMIMGDAIPEENLLSDPLLASTKLYMWNMDKLPDKGRRHCALYQDSFMYDMRKYLKSDEDMLRSFTSHQLANPEKHGIINYITNYYGFTLMDLVSYDRKHNEDNGEDNKDGTDYNFSWNCGFEGKSRKKNVLTLRRRQIENVLLFLYMSAGVPKLMAGDEFGNSQKGNNNAYCQDNNVTWLNWGDLNKNRHIFEYIKKLIAFRKESTLLRDDHPKSLMDRNGVGFPDLSYHGEQAWYPRFESYSRTIGCMYAGKDEYIYAAYNMYWIEEPFALPKLPKKKKWYMVLKTGEGFLEEPVELVNQDKLIVSGRCSVLLIGK